MSNSFCGILVIPAQAGMTEEENFEKPAYGRFGVLYFATFCIGSQIVS